MIPNIIRYQPKLSKLCFLTNDIKNLITKSDTKNAVSVPAASTIISVELSVKPSSTNFTTFKNDAPAITGIDKKNENSALVDLEHPINIAPRIVTPLLDVPGINANNCIAPIISAVL